MDDGAGKGRKAVFLDRDGTINREVDFLGDPADLELEPGAARGLAILQDAGFVLVVISNQSGVARDMFTEDDVMAVNARLSSVLEDEGVGLEHFYYCPHHPQAPLEQYRKVCDCRKPKPGLVTMAVKELGLDPAASYTVGDSRRDLEAGRRVGTRTALVLTGHTRREDLAGWDFQPDKVASDLLEACLWIVEDSKEGGGWR